MSAYPRLVVRRATRIINPRVVQVHFRWLPGTGSCPWIPLLRSSGPKKKNRPEVIRTASSIFGDFLFQNFCSAHRAVVPLRAPWRLLPGCRNPFRSLLMTKGIILPKTRLSTAQHSLQSGLCHFRFGKHLSCFRYTCWSVVGMQAKP